MSQIYDYSSNICLINANRDHLLFVFMLKICILGAKYFLCIYFKKIIKN